MTQSPFQTITQGRAQGPHRVTEVPEGWSQGHSTFGGIVTAFGYEACAAHADAPARLVTGRLLEPVEPGPLVADVRSIRMGRSVQTWQAKVRQEAQVVALVDVVFGASRPSPLRVPAAPAPVDEGEGFAFGHIPGITPDFLQHFDLRWLEGPPPFTGGEGDSIGGLGRHRTAASGTGALLGLLDAWPAPVLGLHDKPFPAATVQWSAHITGAPLPPDGWTRFRSHTVHCADGYATTHGSLWAPNGDLLAWNEQLVALYAGA